MREATARPTVLTPHHSLTPLTASLPPPPRSGPGALTKETQEHCLQQEAQRGQRCQISPFTVGTSPYLARVTDKGHRLPLLHGTGALLPASAGTGQFLLHGISKAGRRARHSGEVGKSWCVRQDFSRGFIAAGERGSRRGKAEDKDRKEGGERENKQKSFGVRPLQTQHPVQAAQGPSSHQHQ